MQNEELRTVSTQIESLRTRYFDLYDLAPVGYCAVSEKGLILEANLTAATLLGVTYSELVKQPISRFILKEDQDIYYLHRKQLFKTGEPQECELRLIKLDGALFWAHLTESIVQGEDGSPLCRVVIIDITERKRTETYHKMGQEILRILNEPGDLHEAIQRIIVVLKTVTGVDAVGLRLQDGEDFPYFAQEGFSKDFLLAENTLIKRDKDGVVCRDKDDNICLECTCGLVIAGKTDPSSPLYTQGGSCWTNDSFPLLDLPSDQDLRLHPRNNCIHQGYASVALIPVRTRERILGLIQLNDKRKGLFNLQTIEILEGIAVHIGSTLMRKHAEEALRESEERFQLAMDAVNDGLWDWDVETGRVYFSPGYWKILGYDPENVSGLIHSWQSLIHPDDRERALEVNQRCIDGQSSNFAIEYRMRSASGDWMWILGRGKAIHRDSQGRALRMVGTHVDITEHKRVEEALKESEFRARAMLQAIPDLMFRLNSHGVFLDYKADISDLYAQDIPTIIGKRNRDILPPEFVDLLDKKIRTALETGSLQTFEYQLPIPGRGMRDYECRMISSAADEVTAIVRDITERKRHEQQLSAALSEKEVLLREVHHRVKNNLAAIISLMDMQRRNLEDPNGQIILTELSNRIRSMSLVHEKLYRADSLATIDFHDYIQALISHLRTTFGSPDIICRVDAPGVTIPLDLASPCGLIVNELVTNALKYAFPNGKPRPGNTDCRLLVVCTGIMIPIP
jgi:PAS domain S-box-containing protein